MKSSFVKDTNITPGTCLKITPENEAEKLLMNDFFGDVSKMGDVEFVTIEKNDIEEVLLYKLQK